jgi:putative PIN family toxin of toxin-antitoxin system
MRVVIDTNVYISGSLWKGNEERVIDLCTSGKIENYTTFDIIDEIDRVLRYRKLRLTEKEAEQLVKVFLSFSKIVNPNVKVDIVEEDQSDNKFLECAIGSGSDILITGDDHLLNLKEFAGVRIMNSNSFLEEFIDKHY